VITENQDFDKGKLFIGSLCKRGHDWNLSGGSLRTIKKRACVECGRITAKKWVKDNPEKHQELKKKYADKYNNLETTKESKKRHYQANAQRYKESHHLQYIANKEAHSAKSKEYYEKNKDKILEYYKEYRAENRDRLLQVSKDYHAKNREASLRQNKEYRDANKEIISERRKIYRQSIRARFIKRASENRRRSRRDNNRSVAYSTEELKIHLDKFGQECCYCGMNLDMELRKSWCLDHFIPIASGGSDCLNNLVPSCHYCNSSKQDRDPWDWYQKHPQFKKSRWVKLLKLIGKTQSTYNQMPLF
jgi:hypothetical protein